MSLISRISSRPALGAAAAAEGRAVSLSAGCSAACPCDAAEAAVSVETTTGRRAQPASARIARILKTRTPYCTTPDPLHRIIFAPVLAGWDPPPWVFP